MTNEEMRLIEQHLEVKQNRLKAIKRILASKIELCLECGFEYMPMVKFTTKSGDSLTFCPCCQADMIEELQDRRAS